jgi:hypothetical protein
VVEVLDIPHQHNHKGIRSPLMEIGLKWPPRHSASLTQLLSVGISLPLLDIRHSLPLPSGR